MEGGEGACACHLMSVAVRVRFPITWGPGVELRLSGLVAISPGPHLHSVPLPLCSSPNTSKLLKTAELPADRNYVLSAHPHGITSTGIVCNFSMDSNAFSSSFPGLGLGWPHWLDSSTFLSLETTSCSMVSLPSLVWA